MNITIRYFFLFILVLVQFYNSGTLLSLFLSYFIIILLFFLNIFNFKKILGGNIFFFFSRIDFLIILFVISIFRSFFKGALDFSSVIYVSLTVLLSGLLLKVDVQKENFWKNFLNAIFLLSFINIFFYLLGIDANFFSKSRDLTNSRLLGYFGINVIRSNFLFFNNFAYYSMLISFLFLGVYKLDKLLRVKKIAVFLVVLVSLFLLDARGPFISLVITVFFSKIIYKIDKNNFSLILVLVFVLPFAYSFIANYFGLDSDTNKEISSSRDVIWAVFFLNYNPSFWELFFGYGYIGQYISGISQKYDFLFQDWGNSSQISLHNSYLQYIVDVGFLGLLLLHNIIRNTIMKINVINRKEFKLILFYFLLVGVSDMSIQINNFVVFFIFIVIINYVDVEFKKSNKPKN